MSGTCTLIPQVPREISSSTLHSITSTSDQKCYRRCASHVLLRYRLLELIEKYASRKPVLIFCNTRKGCTTAAKQILKGMTHDWARVTYGNDFQAENLPSQITMRYATGVLQCLLGPDQSKLTRHSRMQVLRVSPSLSDIEARIDGSRCV